MCSGTGSSRTGSRSPTEAHGRVMLQRDLRSPALSAMVMLLEISSRRAAWRCGSLAACGISRSWSDAVATGVEGRPRGRVVFVAELGRLCGRQLADMATPHRRNDRRRGVRVVSDASCSKLAPVTRPPRADRSQTGGQARGPAAGGCRLQQWREPVSGPDAPNARACRPP